MAAGLALGGNDKGESGCRLASPRLARIAAISIAAGATCFACYQGNEPVRAGYGDLQFGTTIATRYVPSVKLDLFLASPFHQWTWSGSGLVGNPIGAAPPFDLTAETLDPQLTAFSPLFVQYASNHAFWKTVAGGDPTTGATRDFANQHEVVLFARDPEEMYQTYATLVTALTGAFPEPDWLINQVIPRMPDAATLEYPPQANWQYPGDTSASELELASGGRPLVHFPLVTGDFWENNATPDGPGALPGPLPGGARFPNGAGSVKQVRDINRGLCAKFEPYFGGGGILNQLDDGFFESLEKSAWDSECGGPVERYFSEIQSFVHSTPPTQSAQGGGFFYYWNGFFPNLYGSLVNVTAGINYGFSWKLLDGRLTVEPRRFFAGDTGPLGNAFGDALVASLDQGLLSSLSVPPAASQEDTLAQSVWQEASDDQAFGGLFGDTTCEQIAPGDDSVPVSLDPTTQLCDPLVKELHSLFEAATDLSNPTSAASIIGLSQAEINNIEDTEFAANGGVFSNIRCHKVQDPQKPNPICQYVVRAKRLNVYPDGVELVFVDDPYETSSETYAVWLGAWNAAISTDPNAVSGFHALCDPPTAQTPGAMGRRSFASQSTDLDTKYVCYCAQGNVQEPFGPCSCGSGIKCSFACRTTQALCGTKCCDETQTCIDPANSACQ